MLNLCVCNSACTKAGLLLILSRRETRIEPSPAKLCGRNAAEGLSLVISRSPFRFLFGVTQKEMKLAH